GFLAGLLVGALVGGAIAVLISQEETRDLLVGKVREAGNAAADATGDLRGKVSDVTSQWQNSATDLYERGKHVVEDARSNFEAAVDEGKTTADQMRDDLQRRADA
ncbi:MAG TPA: YtxH domain-containing protein, partial [Candidatus Aquilonibacter sp.]